jgi:Holliday junction resolvasome RuvABC ATP-dependent DNA helicase subunit
MLRTQNPGLARRFPREYAFKFEDYTDDELLSIFMETCNKRDIRFSHEVAQTAIKVLSQKRSLPNFGNVGTLKQLIDSAVAKASSRPQTDIHFISITPDDIDSGVSKNVDPFAPLDKLTNIENIRNGIKEIYNDFKVARDEGSELPDIGHFVFRGAPGTGKTTVARVMADILFQLEIVATKNIVETTGLFVH